MFKKTGLTFRLILAFLAVSAVVLAVGILGLLSTNNLDSISDHMNEAHFLNESLLLREVEHLSWAQTVMIDISTKKSNKTRQNAIWESGITETNENSSRRNSRKSRSY